MGISLYVATTGKGCHKKALVTSSESVGLGGRPRRLVCASFSSVSLSLLFFSFFFFFFFCVCDLFLLVFCSFGSSTSELCLAGEDFENTGHRGPTIQHFHQARPACDLFAGTRPQFLSQSLRES